MQVQIGLVFKEAALQETAEAVLDCLFHGIQMKTVENEQGTVILVEIDSGQTEALETEIRLVNDNLAKSEPCKDSPAFSLMF